MINWDDGRPTKKLRFEAINLMASLVSTPVPTSGGDGAVKDVVDSSSSVDNGDESADEDQNVDDETNGEAEPAGKKVNWLDKLLYKRIIAIV